jgi:hypothetical protein
MINIRIIRGIWWLSGDVVAQLVKATGQHQTEDAAVPSSNPAPPQSPEWGSGTMTVYHKTNLSMVSVSA